MRFDNQKMNEQKVRASKLFKEIARELGAEEIVQVENYDGHTYKIPQTNISAVIYDLTLSSGGVIELYVMKDGGVGRVSFNVSKGTNKTIDSVDSKDKTVELTEKQLIKTIKRYIFAEAKTEGKSKINKRSMDKLLKEVGNTTKSPEDERLEQLKEDLTKGSGKFIALDGKGLFYGIDGWTKKQSEIKTFDTIEDANSVENKSKIVEM